MAFHGALYDGKLNPLAQDMRQTSSFYLADIAQVFGMADLLASAGSGMTSSIAAGRATVKNTFLSTQGGLYHIRNDGSVSTGSHAADPSNPKIDLLTVKVYDSETGGDSSDITTPVILPGTATSGATLANLTGAPGQSGGPSISLTNYIPIAYVLIPAGASSASSFSYLDARPKMSGWTNIATSQSTSSTTYTTLATPDQVSGIVLPTNGLIAVRYQATWQESVAGAARAAIFIGSNQLKVATDGNGVASPGAQAAAIGVSEVTGINVPLVSCPLGLVSTTNGSAYAGDVSTGEAIALYVGTAGYTLEINGAIIATGAVGVTGGPCDIFAAAGTYTVSVQFKTSSGSVTASNRKLWVQAIPFS